MDAEEPLSQRTTGPRAQRRIEREREESQNDDIITTTTRRGPSEEKERRIDALIEQRKKTMQQSAANAPSYEEEPPQVLNNDDSSNYEYLDHTADIQLHGWGPSLENALEQVGIAMFGYMTSLSRIEMNKEQSEEHATGIEIKGCHDLQSLVFNFLQEWLYIFHTTGFVAKEMTIPPIDRTTLVVLSSAKGEVADWNRHTQGTEVKAVTYSHLQVKEAADGRCDIWVIVDI
jgi:SHS2 domain-containing protein